MQGACPLPGSTTESGDCGPAWERLPVTLLRTTYTVEVEGNISTDREKAMYQTMVPVAAAAHDSLVSYPELNSPQHGLLTVFTRGDLGLVQ